MMNTQYLPNTRPLPEADRGVCGVGSQRKDARLQRRKDGLWSARLVAGSRNPDQGSELRKAVDWMGAAHASSMTRQAGFFRASVEDANIAKGVAQISSGFVFPGQ